ncbi:MBL fold metallo-hydrolase [Pontibacter silvestris]|uniref:MBL fold metallo-hydrolase n=1 Tax=Pontibacter silvestris TaxID=2305183 RepID=A0ABW4X287_9BACT|nr:MBL fold metallo-hydrolase [Pontibacter silvestris]MCC9134923.1 MBL fold metallo-hydrolase [Pontibacter silvestris]
MVASGDKLRLSNKDSFYVAQGVWGLKTILVNLYFIEDKDGSWVLVDTGMYGHAHKIIQMAEEIFGENTRPKAIILTHGHFDHVGSLKVLAEEWDVPVYAHSLELPYLTGQSSYPPPDPTVGRGAVAYMSFMYPKKPINIKNRIELLPPDGSVPGLPGWSWIHTPGHTHGHVSFYRDEDKTLLAGDAFITRHGESAVAVMTQKREVHGPPAYYTSDWVAAHHSVEKLANLSPETAATGHGLPMYGNELQTQLDTLVKDFWLKAVPTRGRYVNEPSVADEQGVVSVPDSSFPKILAVAGALTVAGLAVIALNKRNTSNKSHPKGTQRPFSHNRVATGIPPTIDPDHDDPTEHSNNYP